VILCLVVVQLLYLYTHLLLKQKQYYYNIIIIISNEKEIKRYIHINKSIGSREFSYYFEYFEPTPHHKKPADIYKNERERNVLLGTW